jgi:YfiR/HmsC-like
MHRTPVNCQTTNWTSPGSDSRAGRHLAGTCRHRWVGGLVCLLAWASSGWAADSATTHGPQTPAAAGTGRGALVTVVAGIVAYTRWPDEIASIRLCTMGQGRGVDDLLRGAELGSAQRSVSVRAANNPAEPWKECDAIFVGHVDAGVSRALLQRSLGRPVLMLGEGAEFCSDGGMFCLEPAVTPVKFRANLDAIARSGLRVNPLVLRIARQSPVSGS